MGKYFFKLAALGWACCFLLYAAPPALEIADVSVKLSEMTRAHATHKELDKTLVQRALVNYVDLLDPAKTYFIEEEIAPYLDANDRLLEETLAGYDNGDFSAFIAIHSIMVNAVERRTTMEQKIVAFPLPTGVRAEEFDDLDWAQSEADLRSRLLRLRAYQVSIAEKIGDDDPEVTLQLLDKRRSKREREIVGADLRTQEQIQLAHILKATASALDSQTAYFTPEEASNFIIDLQQRLSGIGVQMRDSLNGFSIVRVIEGGPADMEGNLKAKDLIVGVDGTSVIGLDITDAVQYIRGRSGTPVVLTVMRKNGDDMEKHNIEIVRGEVVLKEARIESSHEPYGDGVIGRIALYSFYQDPTSSSAADVLEAINDLRDKHNLKGLVLDLRRNTGGILPQAIAVTGLFITKGIVASIRDNDGNIQFLRDAGGHIAYDGPLVVLVSRLSASASEIVAGALQDYGRALIVGDETTFGKGTFQTATIDTMPGGKVNPKGEYKVTRGTYFTVSGRSPQLEGIKSDIVAPGVFSELEIGERFSKFPLANDAIPANFEDDLSDIPPRYRDQVRRTYHYDLQQRMTAYTSLLHILRQNSAERMRENHEYQQFLASLGKESEKRLDDEDETDYQLFETYNVMKDLIFLIDNNSPVS